MTAVWSCCWNTKPSGTFRETPSVHCTVLCESVCARTHTLTHIRTQISDYVDWRFLTVCVVCCRMNDNEGVAEMLLDSLGSAIVNTIDSKGR